MCICVTKSNCNKCYCATIWAAQQFKIALKRLDRAVKSHENACMFVCVFVLVCIYKYIFAQIGTLLLFTG